MHSEYRSGLCIWAVKNTMRFLLQMDMALAAEVQTSRQQLEEERDRGRHPEEHCQQLREQTGWEYQGVREQSAVAVLQP